MLALFGFILLSTSAAFAQFIEAYPFVFFYNSGGSGSGEFVVTDYIGRGGEVSVPSSLGGTPVTSISYSVFQNETSITSVWVPDSIKSAVNFSGCTGLTNVYLGSNVESLSFNNFQYCTALTNIDVATNNTNYSSIDGVLYTKDYTTLLVYPQGKLGQPGFFAIPTSVTTIGVGAFRNFTNFGLDKFST